MPFTPLSELLSRPPLEVRIPAEPKLTGTAAFLSRPSSFSFVVFRGSLARDVVTALEPAGWREVERARARGTLADLNAYSAHAKKLGPRQWEVVKAIAVHAGHTVLLDREMVLATNSKWVSAFCRQHQTRAWGVIWERVSQTLILNEVGPEGVLRSSWWEGAARKDEKAPWPHVVGGDPSTILLPLKEAGLPVDSLFAETVLEADVLLLAEG